MGLFFYLICHPPTLPPVTPGVNNITVNPDSGKLLSSVIVNGDSDLISSNIKKGVNIFGVDGSMEEGMAADWGCFFTATKGLFKFNGDAPDAWSYDQSGVGLNSAIKNIKYFEIQCTRINDYSFNDTFIYVNNAKIKLLPGITYISGDRGFGNIGSWDEIKSKLWIPKSVTSIAESVSDDYIGPFFNAFVDIYCEVSSQPSGWDYYWDDTGNVGRNTVTWGVTEAQFDAM